MKSVNWWRMWRERPAGISATSYQPGLALTIWKGLVWMWKGWSIMDWLVRIQSSMALSLTAVSMRLGLKERPLMVKGLDIPIAMAPKRNWRVMEGAGRGSTVASLVGRDQVDSTALVYSKVASWVVGLGDCMPPRRL